MILVNFLIIHKVENLNSKRKDLLLMLKSPMVNVVAIFSFKKLMKLYFFEKNLRINRQKLMVCFKMIFPEKTFF